MVKYQIRARGICDRKVLDAMCKVERHLFVPSPEQAYAYEDYPLPIGNGQTISQPYIVAFMTDQLHLKSGSKVLEIGTGSGYQAAILAELCDSVFSIEIYDPLAKHADSILKSLGYHNIFIKTGDGYSGWPEHAPFDGILVTCASTHIPESLIGQLSKGGRMVIPIEKSFNGQNLVLITKKHGKLKQSEVLPVLFVPMIDRTGQQH